MTRSSPLPQAPPPAPATAALRPARGNLRWATGGLLFWMLCGAAVYLGFTTQGSELVAAVLTRLGVERAPVVPPVVDRKPTPAAKALSEAETAQTARPWDGLVRLTEAQRQALGVRTAIVAAQTEPVLIELQGKTDYNPDTLVKVRPRFDALVMAVHATVGQEVSKGDPLIDLYSVRLAEAKLSYESKQSQSAHDRQIASQQRDLASKGVIPPTSRILLDAENLERRSELEFKLARDELQVFGVPTEEIESVAREDGTQKAKMTLRAQADGTIIARDVVVGNIYDEKDTLLTISELDTLWVWGQVYERDLSTITIGLPWEVQFPFTKEVVEGQVEYVANQVDPETHAVRIRGSIPNDHGRFKSDQLVRVVVKKPPTAGNTTVPRIAVFTADGDSYAFVASTTEPDAFECRKLKMAHEFRDHVIVSEGLAAGEIVVTNGSILLAQIHEDSGN